ncbi:MAG: sigma-70 family RNA polymerase sigma factor [Actinomycetota bacterium]|nr:sigma-70 family RNA polymerase sigma factor [Actinomycetota bacterium]
MDVGHTHGARVNGSGALALWCSVDPDRELVEQARAGDTAAFETLVERHRDVVFRVAARVVGRHDAEDVAQDAFLRAFHRLGLFRGESTFRAWLLQITHNTALNAAARRVPEPVGGPEEAGPGHPSPVSERQPAAALEETERRDRLELKLRELRSEHRVVLVLRDLEGLAYEEIAQVTDSPLGSVKGRLHRARGELIQLLRRNTYDWDLPR